ncbi:hypothetical protein AB0J85_00325 [Micromonospora echinofusca]|uniref:hypothetical protein n=1 Tax=Micromonospora echinofusca TaxID=47858 RepID=UPI00344494A9
MADESVGLPDISNDAAVRPGAAFDRIVGNMVNTGVTTWLTSATGSAESAALVGGMAGPLAEELSFAIRKVLAIQQQRGQVMVEGAAQHANIELDELLARLTSDPAKVELLVRALESAARATTDVKLDLIADLLATGALAADETVVDEQLLAMDAIGRLDTPHFRLMHLLDGRSPVWWADENDRRRLRYAWPESRILDADPGLKNSLTALVSRCQSLGVVDDLGTPAHSEKMWALTPFGQLCIAALRERRKLDSVGKCADLGEQSE